jgi:xanthine dehydrogenase accessory factor
MIKSLSTWQLVIDSLQKKTPVMLLYVLESHGSSPGRRGFFMAVNAKGEMEGSIGGGIMEHKFVEMAKEKLRDAGAEPGIRKQVHDKSAARDQSGMICSGEQTILIHALQKGDEKTIRQIISSLGEGRNGTLQLSASGIAFSDDVPENDFHFYMRSEGDWQYREKTGYKNHVFIVGGGHCSLALSRLMSGMDFYVHVYDDREGLQMLEDNEYAHEKRFVGHYGELEKMIPGGDHHYAVIMTMGYRTDEIALRALMNKELRYLGMLGSKTKIEKMFAALRAEGIDEKLLLRIHAPIGIHIKSETPGEIAVSIAAEIIKVKNS